MPATAVLMPTTRPRESASAPPELPGLSAASVWITSSISRAVLRPRAGMLRPSALTTPAVTEPARPSGLPTATTSEPTRSVSASPYSGGLGTGAIGPYDGQVAQRVAADDLEAGERAVGELRLTGGRLAHDVGVGDEVALGAEHDRGAGRLAAPAADAQRRDARGQRVGHPDHDR